MIGMAFRGGDQFPIHDDDQTYIISYENNAKTPRIVKTYGGPKFLQAPELYDFWQKFPTPPGKKAAEAYRLGKYNRRPQNITFLDLLKFFWNHNILGRVVYK